MRTKGSSSRARSTITTGLFLSPRESHALLKWKEILQEKQYRYMPSKSSEAASKRRPAAVKPPVLMERTQPVIERLSALLGEPVITYWNSTKGSICQNDVAGLYALLRNIGKVDRLSLFLKSDGGSGQAALRMVNVLRRYAKNLTVLAPLECQSAATMLALGADRILMGPLAHLSAVDTSLTHDLSPIDRDNDRVSVSNDELLRVIRLWGEQAKDSTANPYEALFPYVHPLVIGAVDRSSALSTRICEEILSYHMADKERAHEISNVLNAGYPSHNYPITLREAARIGLNVEPMEDCVNAQLFELNEIYSEMGQSASTDYDERNSHDNSILNILETNGMLIYFQLDKDWHYRSDERRWVALNEKSSWRKAEIAKGKVAISQLHVR
jgi:Serine dehydrogenase proteinase